MNPRRISQHDTLPPGMKSVAANPLALQQTVRRRSAPVSNTERQREFRERNPGYYGRLKAKERAECKARVAKKLAIDAILGAYRTMPLMLPAPVEPLEIPGITTIPRRDEIRERVLVEIRKAA